MKLFFDEKNIFFQQFTTFTFTKQFISVWNISNVKFSLSFVFFFTVNLNPSPEAQTTK